MIIRTPFLESMTVFIYADDACSAWNHRSFPNDFSHPCHISGHTERSYHSIDGKNDTGSAGNCSRRPLLPCQAKEVSFSGAVGGI
ncbi:MAG: hypothetical protein II458_06115 [Oscillospiraceae bacterium]|nr:hypothetical protein [Oscillospiraceae bacterium]